MRKVYRGQSIEVTFDRELCIHVGECLLGLPSVFDLDRRPWIAPDGAETDSVADTVRRCPSGALLYRRVDGGPQEEPLTPARITPLRNGPLLVRGQVEISTVDGPAQLPRATLCRCGLSNNKPFCDNSHLAARFTAEGERIRVRVSAVRPAPEAPISLADDPRA